LSTITIYKHTNNESNKSTEIIIETMSLYSLKLNKAQHGINHLWHLKCSCTAMKSAETYNDWINRAIKCLTKIFDTIWRRVLRYAFRCSSRLNFTWNFTHLVNIVLKYTRYYPIIKALKSPQQLNLNFENSKQNIYGLYSHNDARV